MEQEPHSPIEYRRWLKLMPALVVRPRLWPVAARFIPERWWARPPHLPIPPKEYIGLRMETAYGDQAKVPSKEEFIEFMEWAGGITIDSVDLDTLQQPTEKPPID